MAGAILSLLDKDEAMTHPEFRRKLEAVGFGIFIPVFFVTSGVKYDLDALLSSTSNVIMVPIFLAALVAARGLPALIYRQLLDARHTMIAGLMQATSLPFIVAAVAIGEDLDLVTAAEGAALVGAGLLSVLLFPLIGLSLLKRGKESPRDRAGLRGDHGHVGTPTQFSALSFDRLSVRAKHVPVTTELDRGLAVDLTGGAVALVVVNGMACVGGLELPIAAPGHPDQPGLGTRDGRRSRLDYVRRPGRGAVTRAPAALATV